LNFARKDKRAVPQPPQIALKEDLRMTLAPRPSYQTRPNLLALVRELYSRRPETRDLEPWELQHVLFSLGYTAGLAREIEIGAAVEVARTDANPDGVEK
jgi:hypothetical protein